MPRVNPDILKWARETAGLTLKEAADKVDINAARGVSAEQRLAEYEAGQKNLPALSFGAWPSNIVGR